MAHPHRGCTCRPVSFCIAPLASYVKYIIPDGQNNKPTMAKCGNFSGQMWTLTSTKTANIHRLKTQFTGKSRCLDIINDGQNNKPTMADCGNFSGQMWFLVPTGTPGVFQLRTEFTGPGKCLDIINDGQNNKPTMAKCGNFSGQMWRMTAF